MADDGNFGVHQPLHQFQAAAAALNLDRLGARLFDEADRIGHSVGYGGMIGAIGHVRDDHSAAHRAVNGPSVVQHFFDRDRQSAVQPHDHHSQRIADQN